MDKNKLKRYIIITLIIFVILLIVFILSRMYFTSKSYIMSLLKKGNKNVNYSISYNDDELVDYVKGLEEKLIFSDGKIYYANYESGEAILVNPEEKTIEISNVEAQSGPHSSLYIKDIERMSFEYVNIKKVNSNDCIVIKLSDNDNNNVNYLTKKIYINKKLGIIEKIEKYTSISYGEDTLISKQSYKMHTGEVTEENVSRPDLSKYSNYVTIDNRAQ